MSAQAPTSVLSNALKMKVVIKDSKGYIHKWVGTNTLNGNFDINNLAEFYKGLRAAETSITMYWGRNLIMTKTFTEEERDISLVLQFQRALEGIVSKHSSPDPDRHTLAAMEKQAAKHRKSRDLADLRNTLRNLEK